MEIGCAHEKCTGCMACINSCPRNAIVAKSDTQGFLFPEIDQKLCVSCGKCKTVCPQLTVSTQKEPKQVYAMLAKDDELRERSSSGGIFSLIARNVLKKGGVVFGAAFDENWRVNHRCAYDEEQLDALRTSKYVQSDIGLTFREVEMALKQGKLVLFVGTPCQIDGLNHFLGRDYEGLLTIDLVCHGVPSPGVYTKWIEHETDVHGKIKTMSFKKKIPGWKSSRARIEFENGDVVDCKQNEGFMGGFLQNIYLRKSCYQCPYTRTARVSDVTLGVFWGYKETKPEHIEDDDHGISLVIINTCKGEEAVKRIRSKVALAPRTIEDAKQGNLMLSSPAECSEKYNGFWENYSTMTWEELMTRYAPSTSDLKDWMHPMDRAYYAIPYSKRHFKHVLHCKKLKVINTLKRLMRK